jgi:hypothetical protein
MPDLTPYEWAGVAVLFFAFVLVLLWLRLRVSRVPPGFRTFQLQGKAMPAEFEQVFGPYGQGGVRGVVVLQDGIRVQFGDHHNLRFIPVVDGDSLYWTEAGQIATARPS